MCDVWSDNESNAFAVGLRGTILRYGGNDVLAMLAVAPGAWSSMNSGVTANLADVFGFEEKRARAAREGVAAWVDPEGYRRWVVGVREKFEATVNAELGAAG